MDKQQWISAKIAKLINEGEKKERAIAIAYSMWEEGSKKQEGGFNYSVPNMNFNTSMPTSLNTAQYNAPMQYQVPQMHIPQVPKSMVGKFQQPTGFNPGLGLEEQYSKENINKNAVAGVLGAEPKEDTTQNNDWVKYNILNPYGQGMDLNTSLAYTGQQFGKGNTGMGIVGAGLSTLKGVRSFMSGYGSGRGQQNVEQQLHENLYNKDENLYQGGGYTEGEEELYGQDLINKYPNSAEVDYRLSQPTVSPEATVQEQAITQEPLETKNFDENSARDTWVKKTGLPWSEAKRLGYTDGTAKDNTKLLAELNDTRFKKENIRSKPFAAPVQAAKADAAQVVKVAKLQNFFDSAEYKALPKNKKAQAEARAVKEAGGWEAVGRTVEVLGNPLKSFGEYAKYGELPARGFSKHVTNSYDDVLGIINPASWGSHGANAVDYTEQGEYKEALKEAAGALPAAGKLLKTVKYIPYLQGLPEASTTFRAAGNLGQGAKRLAPTVEELKQLGSSWGGYSNAVGDYVSGSYIPHQQGGYTVGNEYDLTEEEIRDLVSKGYKIKYK